MSQTSNSDAPPKATMGKVLAKFSPYFSATKLGTTSPTKGMAPTVITVVETVMATSIKPMAAIAA